jgi:hypothetical protein
MGNFNFRTGGVTPKGSNSKTNRDSLGPARVIDIILDDSHPKYKEYDGTSAVGMILYRLISEEGSDPSEDGDVEYTGQAFPINHHSKLLPLKNEIVFLTKGPDPSVDEGSSASRVYYTTPYSIWNHPHHNAIPAKSWTSSDVNIGDGIDIDDKIAPLQPFPGDMILEGRLGHSIRFTGGLSDKSPFIEESNKNKPLIILRNGQKETENGFEHIVEDINEDSTSIYLTSDHSIPLTLSNDKRDSYDDKPDTPESYQGAQLLFNSNRLILNSKESDILLSSPKSIGLNSNTVNIDGKDYMCIDADKIYLGVRARTNSGANKQPAVLGHRMEAFMQDVLDQLISMANAMAAAKVTGHSAIPTLNLKGNSAKIILKQLKRQLNPKGGSNLKSKKLFIE